MGKRIDNTVCHCLKMRRSAENVIRFYDAILAPADVTSRQYSLLSAVQEHSGCSVRVLSEATLLDRSTLARSLKPLIESGYIVDKRQKGTRDRILELSEKGFSVCKKAAALWKVAQGQLEERLGKEQLTTLENILELLQDL